ncbi:uncharacterized protein LOC110675812 [Aedes aegypti]|uniref:Uncharacterized protein n=1 Tax=Aedes aegypti TaxID=7159 RepID=A0A6I8TXJ1_AEDAE|nr:uncharacterized protein LOC110675812 [Aedes aegypti]
MIQNTWTIRHWEKHIEILRDVLVAQANCVTRFSSKHPLRWICRSTDVDYPVIGSGKGLGKRCNECQNGRILISLPHRTLERTKDVLKCRLALLEQPDQRNEPYKALFFYSFDWPSESFGGGLWTATNPSARNELSHDRDSSTA